MTGERKVPSVFRPWGEPVPEVPPHLYGRWKHDPLLRFGKLFFGVTIPAFAHLMKPRKLAEPNTSRELRVVSREVVAHDKDVVALTFVAADDTPLPVGRPGPTST